MIKPKIGEQIRIVGDNLLPMIQATVVESVEFYPCDATLDVLLTITLAVPRKLAGPIGQGMKGLAVVERKL